MVEDRLLLLDCSTLSDNLLGFFQCEIRVHLEMLRQGTVADSDKYAISDHLVLQVSVLAIGCQAVKAGDELFGCFSIALCSPVESRSLENNVLPNFEELVHLAQDLV